MKKIIIILTILIFPFRVLAASEIAVLDLDSGRFLYELRKIRDGTVNY